MHEGDALGNDEEDEPGVGAGGLEFHRHNVGASTQAEGEGNDTPGHQSIDVGAHSLPLAGEGDPRGQQEFPALQIRCRVVQL